jgi:hypothetical protein
MIDFQCGTASFSSSSHGQNNCGFMVCGMWYTTKNYSLIAKYIYIYNIIEF